MTHTDPRTAGYQGSFDGHLPPARKPALIVVDVCDAYLLPSSPLYAAAFVDTLPVIARLVEAARAECKPVIHTRVVYQKGGIDGGLFYRKVPALRVFEAGSPFALPPAIVRPQEGEVVITKQYASAFFGTSLSATLTALRVDGLLLTGFSTSGCIRATALDALQHGFAPYVVASACGDRNATVQDANLFDLQSKYAEVIDEVAALAILHAG